MLPFRMTFAVTKTPDGLYHVQNTVGGLLGQHHVHTEEGYLCWMRAAGNVRADLSVNKGTCDCSLKPGWIREYDGRVWFNDRFDGEKR